MQIISSKLKSRVHSGLKQRFTKQSRHNFYLVAVLELSNISYSAEEVAELSWNSRLDQIFLLSNL